MFDNRSVTLCYTATVTVTVTANVTENTPETMKRIENYLITQCQHNKHQEISN